jgi:hypothetical protein
LNNAYLFSLIDDGRFALYSIVDGSYHTLADAQPSAAIKRDRALNHVRLSVLTGTLKIDVNDQAVLQAAIAYTPGFVGLWCGVYAPPRTRCTFDNLSVVGTPSTGPLTIYPFCNCRREARVGQPLTTVWLFGAKTSDLLKNLQSRTIMTATLDGQPIDQPQQYWGKTETSADGAQARWRFNLPTLDPGSHVLALTVHSDVELTDGFDGNGDGKPDTYGPGDFLSGYVEIVVQP